MYFLAYLDECPILSRSVEAWAKGLPSASSCCDGRIESDRLSVQFSFFRRSRIIILFRVAAFIDETEILVWYLLVLSHSP